MWRASRGADARPPEARSGPQFRWDYDVPAVVRDGCAPGSADSVMWLVEPVLNQWKPGLNRSGIGQVADYQRAVPKKWALSRRPLAKGDVEKRWDHDPPAMEKLAPFGILMVASGALILLFGSRETGDA